MGFYDTTLVRKYNIVFIDEWEGQESGEEGEMMGESMGWVGSKAIGSWVSGEKRGKVG